MREVHKKRRELVKSVCIRNGVYATSQNIVPQKFSNIYVNDEYKFLYCSIPKIACTNWKRVLLVLSGKVNTTDPMALSPNLAHSNEMAQHLRTLKMYTKKQLQYRLKNYFKFIFVREPLERLLSAYSNKFTVSYNSYFPEKYGRYIVKKFRKNPSKKALKTGRSVTFPEFVKYVLDKDTPKPYNGHWREYYKMCYPCLIDYDAVGKYETFDDDVNYILNATGIDSVIKFPGANRITTRPKTSNILALSYANISSEEIHKLWETYSVDYAMFDYPYPDFKHW